MTTPRPRLLNIGCGSRYHPDWINIDLVPSGPSVVAHDLTTGIPLADNSCDVIYHSSVLEHLRRPDALMLMRECFRVCKPRGTVRVAVPDLEHIARLYLQKLDAALSGDASGADCYTWMLLEMYDQAVRERSGGEMLDYLRQDSLPNEAFVFERIGEEGRAIAKSTRNRGVPGAALHDPPVSPARLAGAARIWVGTLPGRTRERLLRVLLGKHGMRALAIGRFRLSGEAHQWMYDRYSLAQLMLASGFRCPTVQSASESRISGWASFGLDILGDGTVVKPDSLFMEGVKLGGAAAEHHPGAG